MTAEKTTASDAYGTREQKTRTFRYDAVNRLSEVSENGKCLQKNVYDAEGLRSEMDENDRLVKFLYDGDKVITERDDTKGLKRYIRGYELVSSDCEQARTYYHYASDELGSITDVLNYKGEVLNHYEYDAFGEFSVREEQVENRFAFAGEQFDPATNLYYLRARFYNPVIGRFIQEDTYYGDGLNLYAYCHNNPVGYVDPSGHDACPYKQDSVKHLQEQNGLTEAEATRLYESLRATDEYKNMTPEEFNKKLKSGELDNRYGVITFENKDGKYNVDEYTRQLKGQEKGLNVMDKQTNKKNRQDYENRKSATGNGRDPRSNKAQNDYRKKEIKTRAEEIRKNEKISKAEARAKAKAEYSGMAALHDPDQVAGGFYNHITGMGDRGINSSIGSQWGLGNADQLAQYVDNLPNDNTKLVVLLILR